MSRIFVGNLSRNVRRSDLEKHFSEFGSIQKIDLKSGYAFIDYKEQRDADDAIRELNYTKFDGQRIVVELSRSSGHRRERSTGDRCFVCNESDHWARDCPYTVGSGDCRSGNCFKCGEPGHLARNCGESVRGRDSYRRGYRGRSRSRTRSFTRSNSRSVSRRRSRSRSPSRSRSRSRSSFRARSPRYSRRSRTRSRSRSPRYSRGSRYSSSRYRDRDRKHSVSRSRSRSRSCSRS
ncbi:uncharacterized protein LOC135144908 [Zophobas morio]|uniref:uncharacterized protein LOC135144908 n=1 Tax=Zophobas morio TaxID=2755281 RepID=UPI0030829F48